MKVTEIAFVCYAVKDLKRARAFYEKTLGLEPSSVFEKEDMGFIEYWIGPHTLAIGAGAPKFRPGKEGPCAALEVENFAKAVDDLKKKKVKFVMEPMDAGSCDMGIIEDPDGNQIMIHKRKMARSA